MKNMRVCWRKTIALVLAVAMIFTLFNGTLMASATVDVRAGKSVTTGQLLSSQYGLLLTTAEKELLNSGLLDEQAYQYVVPTENDELVKVDFDTKTISAAVHNDEYNNSWVPTKAIVAYSDNGTEETEQVGLTKSEAGYTGTFKYSGNAYSIKVVYEFAVNVDKAAQKKMLLVAGSLKRGLTNLMVLGGKSVDSGDAYGGETFENAASKATLKMAEENIEQLYSFVKGYKLESGVIISISDKRFVKGAEYLYNQKIANNGKLLLSKLLEDYEKSASKTEYLMKNGAEIKAEAQKTMEAYQDILSYRQGAEAWISMANRPDLPLATAQLVFNNFESAVDEMQVVLADDNWGILTNGGLKPELTAADYQRLDALAADITIKSLPDYDGIELTESLTADSVEIEINQNRYAVTVKLEAEAIGVLTRDSVKTTPLKSYTKRLNLAEGISKDDILTAVSNAGIEEAALADWNNDEPLYAVNAENYERKISSLPDSLNKDIELVISYIPKEMQISCGGDYALPGHVPYGYNMTLPKYADETQVYDYQIEGRQYLQGDVVRVTKDLEIKRTQDKPWDEVRLNDVVASLLDETSAAVLKSDAVISDSLRIRTPEGELVQVKQDGNKFTAAAKTYNSGLNGLLWVPVSGRAETDGDAITFELCADGSEYIGEFTADSVSGVDVVYELSLESVVGNEEFLKVLNIPSVLVKQSKVQKEALAVLNDQYNRLAELNGNANSIRLALNGAEEDEITDEIRAAGLHLVANCYDEQGNLIVYNYLTEYRKSGLAWYYSKNTAGSFANYQNLSAQLEILKKDLPAMCDDEGVFKEFLKSAVGDRFDVEKYYGVMEELVEKIANLELTAPAEELIDGYGSGLTSFITALENAGQPEEFTSTAGLQLKLNSHLPATLSGQSAVTVKLQVQGTRGGSKTYTDKLSFSNGELTEDDITAINELKNRLVRDNVDSLHYELSGASDKMPESGYDLKGNVVLTFIYVPKAYTVEFAGEGVKLPNAVLYYDYPTVVLPFCDEAGYRYDYIIGNERVSVFSKDAEYNFAEKIDSLFDGGKYTVKVEKIDIQREKTLNMVKTLNKAVSGMVFEKEGKNCLAMAFIPVEDADGNISIVLRVSPQSSIKKIGDAVEGIGKAFVDSGFDSITLNGELFSDPSGFSVQAVVNMLLNSGLGMDTVERVIDDNGNINEMTLEGEVAFLTDGSGFAVDGAAYVNNAGVYGGKLMETVLGLDGTDVDFYVTVEDFDLRASKLKEFKNSVRDLRKYADVVLADGEAILNLNLPDKAYQLYLLAMLATGYADISALDELDLRVSVEYLYGLAAPVLKNEAITVDTYQNTLNKLGIGKNLPDAVRKYYAKLQKALIAILNNSKMTNVVSLGSNYSADIECDASALLDLMGVSEGLKTFIKESGGSIIMPVNFTLENMNTSYQALLIDPKAAGKKNKIGFTFNLNDKIKSVSESAVVILTDDYNGDIATDKAVFLDLNGHTVYGNVSGGNITLIDSTLDNSGAVRGNITVKNDIRTNDYYYITTDGNNIKVNLKASALNKDALTGLKNTAFELAFDLALNYYTTASISVDGNELYNVDCLNDLVKIYGDGINADTVNKLLDCINCAGTTEIFNDLLDKLTAFGKMADAAGPNGKNALFSFAMNTASWDVKPYLNESGNYITADIAASSANGASQTLSVHLAGSDEEVKSVVELLKLLDETCKIETNVTLSDINYANRVISAVADGSADVVLEMTDPKYSVILAVLTANSVEDPELKDRLVAAVKDYYSANSAEQLHDVLGSLTVSQFVNALKNFNREQDFAEIVAELGLSDIITADVLETMNNGRRVVDILCGLMRRLKVEGSNVKLSGKEGEYGIYELFSRSDVNKVYEKYGVSCDITLKELKVTLKLFTENAPSLITVYDSQNQVIYSGSDFAEALQKANEVSGAVIEVTGVVALDRDVTVSSGIVLNGAENITFNGNILLTENGTLTADKELAGIKAADGKNYYIVTEVDNGRYVYSAALYTVVVTDANGNVLYQGADTEQAFSSVKNGSTVKINGNVALTKDTTISCAVNIEGVTKLGFAGYNLILGYGEDGKTVYITADDSIDAAVVSASQYSRINKTVSGSTYRYELTALVPELDSSKKPDISLSDNTLVGAKVDTANKYIYLDTHYDGITAEQFNSQVKFDSIAVNASKVETEFAAGSMAEHLFNKERLIIRNGAKVTVTASNPDSSQTATAVYTVIIMGDTNANGINDAADSRAIIAHVCGRKELEGVAYLAGDINQQKIDISKDNLDAADARKNLFKFLNWSQYKSALK